MNAPARRSGAVEMDLFLSNAYRRMQRTTILLGTAAAAAAALRFGWRLGLGAAIGAVVAYVNFAWLHHSSAMVVERMAAQAADAASKLKIILAFGGRYIFVIAMAYVIFKSRRGMLVGFAAALFLPILAAMVEGVYEAFAGHKIKPEET